MDGKYSFIPSGQCQSCWCPCDTRNQGLHSRGIELVLHKYSHRNVRNRHPICLSRLNCTPVNLTPRNIWPWIWILHAKLCVVWHIHYGDVIMDAIASQITSLTIVYSIVYSDADQRKHQSSASLAFVRRIHRGPVNSPHKWPVTRKMFPFDDVIMISDTTGSTIITSLKRSDNDSELQLYICNTVIDAVVRFDSIYKTWPQ